MGRSSQSWALIVGMTAAIEGDAGCQAILAPPGIYDVMPPANTPYPYSTFGSIQETDDDVFAAHGTLASQQLDWWTRIADLTDPDSSETGTRVARQINVAFRNLFHQRPLAVPGFRYVMGLWRLIAIAPDPDGEHNHGIGIYDVIARESA